MKNILIKDTPLDKVYVSEEVIKQIVEKEVLEEVGVGIKDFNWFQKILTHISSKNTITVDYKEKLVIEVPLKIVYGMNIPTVCCNVQKRVFEALEIMLNIKGVTVIIIVEGLIFPENE